MIKSEVKTNYKTLLPAEIVIKELTNQKIAALEMEKLQIKSPEELAAAVKTDKNWTLKTRVDMAHFFGTMVIADKFSPSRFEPITSGKALEENKAELLEDLSRKVSFLDDLIGKL